MTAEAKYAPGTNPISARMDAAGPAARAGFEGDTFRGGTKIMKSMRDTVRPPKPFTTMSIGVAPNGGFRAVPSEGVEVAEGLKTCDYCGEWKDDYDVEPVTDYTRSKHGQTKMACSDCQKNPPSKASAKKR